MPTPTNASVTIHYLSPELGRFPPKPNHHIYIPTATGWISVAGLTPARGVPADMPKQSDDLFKDLGDSDSGREGSVAERNRKVRGKLCRNASMESMLGEGLEREEVAGAGGSAVVEDGGGGARMDGGGRELNAASGKGGGDEGCAEGVVVGSAEDGRCVDFGGDGMEDEETYVKADGSRCWLM